LTGESAVTTAATGSEVGSSAGVLGNDDSSVEVELIESLIPLCICGAFVGDACSFKPRVLLSPTPLGRPETPKAGVGDDEDDEACDPVPPELDRRGSPSIGLLAANTGVNDDEEVEGWRGMCGEA
jgi:hypothetical protein